MTIFTVIASTFPCFVIYSESKDESVFYIERTVRLYKKNTLLKKVKTKQVVFQTEFRKWWQEADPNTASNNKITRSRCPY